jgi:hypothetical protein
MSVVVTVLTLVLLAAVIAVVSRPLLVVRKPSEEPERARRAELEAAREAKYREIRDTELDYRTGKLSKEDFEAVNGALRAEAVEILNRLEAAQSDTEKDHDGPQSDTEKEHNEQEPTAPQAK